MGEMSPWHWLIVIGVFALLFGAKRLPDAARSIGRSTRILKSELAELRSDDTPATSATPATTQVTNPTVSAPVSTEKAAPQAAAG